MAWSLLLLGIAGLVLVVNGLRPVRRLAPLVVPSFAAGWLTSETALHLLAIHLSAAVVIIAGGALGNWPGWLGFGLCLPAWAGLLFLHTQGSSAAGVMEGAISGALGRDYRARLAHVDGLDAPLPPGRMALPLWLVDPAVHVTRNIAYTPAGGRRHQLDVYAPRNGTRGAPVLFQIHGGGWVMGHKAQQARPLLFYMASRGWVCVSANYRLSPGVSWPTHLIDLKRALCWMRQHIVEYGGDAGFIIVTGGSAGGHLAAMMALTANDPIYQPGFEAMDTGVQGAVPFYGLYDFLNREDQHCHGGIQGYLERMVLQVPFDTTPAVFGRASPLSLVCADAPPFLVVHGRNDSLVCVEEARLFVEKLRAVSRQPVAYAELPYAQHAFEVFYSPRTLHVIRGVHRFGCAIHAEYRGSS